MTTATRCAICDALIGRDAGPPDGWQLEDGRTVCHACCVMDLQRMAAELASWTKGSSRP